MQPNNQKEHQMLVVAHMIENAIFVTILGLAAIVGLGNIFWGFQVKESMFATSLQQLKNLNF